MRKLSGPVFEGCGNLSYLRILPTTVPLCLNAGSAIVDVWLKADKLSFVPGIFIYVFI